MNGKLACPLAAILEEIQFIIRKLAEVALTFARAAASVDAGLGPGPQHPVNKTR